MAEAKPLSEESQAVQRMIGRAMQSPQEQPLHAANFAYTIEVRHPSSGRNRCGYEECFEQLRPVTTFSHHPFPTPRSQGHEQVLEGNGAIEDFTIQGPYL